MNRSRRWRADHSLLAVVAALMLVTMLVSPIASARAAPAAPSSQLPGFRPLGDGVTADPIISDTLTHSGALTDPRLVLARGQLDNHQTVGLPPDAQAILITRGNGIVTTLTAPPASLDAGAGLLLQPDAGGELTTLTGRITFLVARLAGSGHEGSVATPSAAAVATPVAADTVLTDVKSAKVTIDAATLALARLTLQPNASLRTAPAGGPVIVAIDAGQLEIARAGKSPATLADGQATALPKGVDATLTATGKVPVTLTVALTLPAEAASEPEPAQAKGVWEYLLGGSEAEGLGLSLDGSFAYAGFDETMHSAFWASGSPLADAWVEGVRADYTPGDALTAVGVKQVILTADRFASPDAASQMFGLFTQYLKRGGLPITAKPTFAGPADEGAIYMVMNLQGAEQYHLGMVRIGDTIVSVLVRGGLGMTSVISVDALKVSLA